MTGLEERPFSTVIIIGAGFSGLTMSCQLKRLLDFDDYCIYDRLDGIGGTWLANTYPGCGVDIPGFCYTLSFALNPDFTQVFPSQPEILQYITHVSKKYDIHRHFTAKTECKGAYWKEDSHTWIVRLYSLETGRNFIQECRILIMAVGGVVNPNKLNVPGAGSFRGEIIHTARWKHDMELKGKDVVVIGNGASAVQLVPEIIGKPRFITQFARTPHHLVPRQNYDISPVWIALFYSVPGLLYFIRLLLLAYMETGFYQFQKGGRNDSTRKKSETESREYVRKTAPAKYWQMLIPTYEFGCKRRVFDHAYTSTLHRNDIRLTSDPIVRINPHSVTTRSGEEIRADAILLATGFALTQYDIDIRGRNGRKIQQKWEEDGHKVTFKSVAMHDFPNFFYVLGPNSGRLHTSTLLSIESFVDLIISTITPIINGKVSSVEVKVESEKSYDQALHEAMQGTVHNSECSSYQIDNMSGKNWFIFPWSSLHMWFYTHWKIHDDWEYEI